ncbi:hypothetical protein BC835DRAFT_1344860 [Cytidiella melzeri]|nr:hypothetical protein BC835DRAFT_1344860 [Cytidiella melzeri]
MSSHCFSSVIFKGISRLFKKLRRKKKPLAEVEAEVEADPQVVTTAVVQDRVEVPVEEESRVGLLDVTPTGDKERADEVFDKGAVAELTEPGGAPPTPRDDETDGEDRTKGRQGKVDTPAVMQDCVEVPLEVESRVGAPDLTLTVAEGRAEGVSNEGAVTELTEIGSFTPTPRDNERRTKGAIFLSIASPTSKVLDYAAEASDFAPLKVVAAGLKFIVEHAEVS